MHHDIDRKSRAGLFAALAAAWVAASCGSSSQAGESSEDSPESAREFVRVVNVEAWPVRRSEFTQYVRVVGAVEARRDVTVSAEEGGVVERFHVEKGARVRRGQPIAKIDDRLLRAQVAEAEAQAALAAERYERQRRLWEEERIGSEMTYLQAKYEAEVAAARLETLRTRLDRTVVTAPISGVLDQRRAEAGETVAAGAPLVRIVELERLKVTGGVPERLAGQVERGDTARVTLDVLPGREFLGIIEYVGSIVDERNRTFPIEVVIDNPGGRVKPQMVANVEVAVRRLADAIVVPQEAILRTEGGYQVFLAEPGEGGFVAAARPVRLGPSYANRTVVEEGLAVGDRLVVRGQQQVDVGNRLRIVQQRPPAAAPAAEGGNQ